MGGLHSNGIILFAGVSRPHCQNCNFHELRERSIEDDFKTRKERLFNYQNGTLQINEALRYL